VERFNGAMRDEVLNGEEFDKPARSPGRRLGTAFHWPSLAQSTL